MPLTVPYRVRQGKVWPFNPVTEAYGTGVACLNLQSVNFDPMHDTDLLKLLGANQEGLSVLTHINVSLNFGGVHWPSMSVMNGTDNTSSGADTNINEDDGADDMPYFGGAFAISLKGGRDAHVYFPKMQLTKRLPLDIQQNSFTLPAIDSVALQLVLEDGTPFKVRYYSEKASETALAEIATRIGLS